jgi:hypothetical protein
MLLPATIGIVWELDCVLLESYGGAPLSAGRVS